ncbi:HAD-IA family hydrolase [Companilactobacillus allii]|uniref:Haloacid dehalogenase n=1 Tax=Companilactobacillus allii TaxID=1847728 RepID=A0A1P8Q4I4_9LACO|nr:HAD-IA family hydrolase [Companilactobacillus allii]APX72772.1 haloacid dehalogenase [Companilactobacillus allii]USQ67560.1 HAD-IA family hydrolase [Companilactobacillus allii]
MRSIVWDFDGTLANSYPGIVVATQKSLKENFDINISKDTIYKEALKTSVRKLAGDLVNGDEDKIKLFYKSYKLYEKAYHDQIKLMPHAKIALEYCKVQGYQQFIVTHRDTSIFQIAKNLEISDYFTEIVSAEDGHVRKPDPEMLNYLISKYSIDTTDLWVIGDRKIDIDFGNTVNAKTILINNSDIDFKVNYQIANLKELNNLI